MQQKGRLSQWDDAKGYGFISPDEGGPRLFVHRQAFGNARPQAGQAYSFEIGVDAQGKPRALKLRSLAPKAQAWRGSRVWLVPGFASAYLVCHLLWPMPPAVWGAYMAMSMATFIVYAGDKRAARLGQPRVPERTLHGLALACGWPGALLAQQLLRHKSAKSEFLRRFWFAAGANVALFVLLATPLLRSVVEWIRAG